MLAYVWRGRATQKQACQNRLATPRKQKIPATRIVANFGEGSDVRFELIATEMGRRRHARPAPDSDRRTDVAGGPKVPIPEGGDTIEALLQNKTSMITASTATIRRRSIPLGFEAALSRTETEASARACARSESAASEAVTSWAGSARKPLRARVSSLPGSP
jgi:hypothetical protein